LAGLNNKELWFDSHAQAMPRGSTEHVSQFQGCDVGSLIMQISICSKEDMFIVPMGTNAHHTAGRLKNIQLCYEVSQSSLHILKMK
jgi:hypothetical protein